MTFKSNVKTIEWQDNHVVLIDQTKLPYSLEMVNIKTYQEMGAAIKDMLVRGAPAIGIAGAFGIALGAQTLTHLNNKKEFLLKLEEIGDYLKSTRPTAVNLSWAVDRQINFIKSSCLQEINALISALINNAIKIGNSEAVN